MLASVELPDGFDVLAPLGFSMTLEDSFKVFAGRSLKDRNR